MQQYQLLSLQNATCIFQSISKNIKIFRHAHYHFEWSLNYILHKFVHTLTVYFTLLVVAVYLH